LFRVTNKLPREGGLAGILGERCLNGIKEVRGSIPPHQLHYVKKGLALSAGPFYFEIVS